MSDRFTWPTSEGLWWMSRTGSVDGACVIGFIAPDKYMRLDGDEINDLPKEGYECRVVEFGTIGNSV